MPPVRHIVYECIPGAYAGGVQKMVFELASAQRRAGADVEIWAPDGVRAGSVEDHEGLPIRYFMPDYELGLVKSYRLERALSSLPQGAVLHAHNSFHPLNLQVGRAAGRHALRHFYSPHGALDPVLLRGWSWKPLKKRIYLRLFKLRSLNRAAGLFALTPLEAQGLREIGVTAPVHVVPNGISPVAVASAGEGAAFRRRLNMPDDAKVILFIGRITPKKRIEDVIRALPELPSCAHLVIAGNPEAEPDYAGRLRREVRSAACERRVHWLGFMDEAAKAAAYAAADAFVHASQSEGMALAILEAMSAGLPAVVTEGCYMGEAAAAGALVQCAQGPAALAEGLASVLADSATAARLGSAGRDYAARVHDWAAIARRSLEIYAGQGGAA